MVCTTVAAGLLVPSWFDLHAATWQHLHVEAHSRKFWCCWHCMNVGMGLIVSFGLAGVALNPWDARLDLHLVFASVVFMGGSALVSTTCLLAYFHELPCCTHLVLLGLVLISYGLMIFFGGVAFTEFGEEPFMRNVHLMHDDYDTYCHGRGASLHRHQLINVAAAFEWTLLASMILSGFLLLHRNLHAWPKHAGSSSNLVMDGLAAPMTSSRHSSRVVSRTNQDDEGI